MSVSSDGDLAVGRVLGGPDGRLLAVRAGEVVHQPPGHHQRLDVVLERAVGDAGFRRVRDRAAELLVRDLLVGHRLHDVGAGHEHVGRVPHHEDEVGHRRRVDRAAGAGAHDQRDLRDHARGEHVALEHLGVAAERGDAFLDARAAGVVQPDHRRADLHRLVHDLADLLGVRLGERAAEHGEVLAEDEDEAAVDRAVAGDDAVARDLLLRHAEVGAAVLDEHVPLLEGAGVEQEVDALARGQLAAGVLRLDALLAAAEPCLRPLLFELADDLLHDVLPKNPTVAPAKAGAQPAPAAGSRLPPG